MIISVCGTNSNSAERVTNTAARAFVCRIVKPSQNVVKVRRSLVQNVF
jgi:hypothetical protein